MGCLTSKNAIPKDKDDNQNIPKAKSPELAEKQEQAPPSPPPTQPSPKPVEQHVEEEPQRSREDIIDYYQNEYPEFRSLFRMVLNVVEKMNNLVQFGVKSTRNLNEAKDALEEFVDTSKIDHTWKILGDFMADINAAKTLTKVMSELYGNYRNMVDDLQGTDTPAATAQLNVFGLTMSLLDLSDKSIPFTVSCAANGLIPVLMEFSMALAAKLSDQGYNWDQMNLTGKLFTQTLGTLHNIAQRVENRVQCSKIKSMVPTLLDWTTTKGHFWGVLALLTLSFIIDEENNHLLNAKEDVLNFMVELLDDTLEQSNRRSLGYSSTELAEGLIQIAANDSNKRLLAELGVIPVLKKMLHSANNEQEQASAAKALYVLSFNEQNRKEIETESETMEILHRLSKSENQQVKNIAEGTLWELEGKHKRAKKAAEGTAPASQQSSGGMHVMISYQWDVQKTMIDVKNHLQAAGYTVWMDIERMEGSTLEAMAKAVENASVVLIGVSQKYKDSPNCRSEAEYTYQVRHTAPTPSLQKRNKLFYF